MADWPHRFHQVLSGHLPGAPEHPDIDPDCRARGAPRSERQAHEEGRRSASRADDTGSARDTGRWSRCVASSDGEESPDGQPAALTQ